jgi:cytochrome c peroxidase
MRTFGLLAVVFGLLTLTGCKTEESKPVELAPAAAPAPEAPKPAEPAKPVEPKVELPPAPAIPAAPAHLPTAEDPADNPTTPEKVALGHVLFFDKRLSKDDSMQCESCHHIDKAWTSGNDKDGKVGGAINKRNAPTVLNLAFHTSFYWDGRKATLEAVSEAAWTGQLGADKAVVAAKLNAIPEYKAMFQRAFKEDATGDNIPKAYAAFFRALKSGNSAFDKFEAGDAKAASKEAQAGFEVFKKAGCTLCHVPPLYSDSMFHNVGVGADLPDDKKDHGRMDATKDAKDDGKFKTPSMRDVAKTGPYFHDGSGKTLDEAIDLMVAGGKKNPNLDEKLKPAKLSKKDRANLKAFLESLSGEYTFTSAPEIPK